MPSISQLPKDQRPREKLIEHGATRLNDAELLAIFLRTGIQGESAIEIGHRLISKYGSLSRIGRLDAKQLASEKGLGPAKAAHLIACFELGGRVAKEQMKAQPLTSPEVIYQFLSPILSHRKVETLLVLAVDSKINLIHYEEVSLGTVSSTTAHPREILRPVILNQAAGFILAHNHPSGDPTPSRADRQLTLQVKDAAELMKITFHDHLIIGKPDSHRDSYYSFRVDRVI